MSEVEGGIGDVDEEKDEETEEDEEDEVEVEVEVKDADEDEGDAEGGGGEVEGARRELRSVLDEKDINRGSAPRFGLSKERLVTLP